MPFEPFYHRDPTKPFAQYEPGATLYVVVNGDELTKGEFAIAYQDYIKWIGGPLAEVGLRFVWKQHPEPPGAGTLVRVTFTNTGSHGARQTNSTTYDITHNAQELKDKKFGASVCLHEFLHILGVPHELHNPLVHFCLKPNWEKILQWESVRDANVKALRSQNKPEEAERADWLA